MGQCVLAGGGEGTSISTVIPRRARPGPGLAGPRPHKGALTGERAPGCRKARGREGPWVQRGAAAASTVLVMIEVHPPPSWLGSRDRQGDRETERQCECVCVRESVCE